MTPNNQDWKSAVAEFQKANPAKASWQLLNTIGPYVAVWILLYFVIQISWWLAIPLGLLGSALFVRLFIIFHDCGHGSFFRSKRSNDIWGCVTGLLTLTPYHHWRWEHGIHHASNGHLDRRGVGDIWTMTVEEYLGSTRWKRHTYRLVRNPLILFVIAPLYLFLIQHRFPLPTAKPEVKASVWITNLAIIAFAFGMISIFGILPYLILQLGMLAVAGTCGVWLFYVQHQFEDTYWESGQDWSYVDAALEGSSYYKLPKVLQWFSGNIGFHHIHHLSAKIPNYHLERCHYSNEMFRKIPPLTFRNSLKTINYRLWDPKSSKLISFSQLKRQLELETSKYAAAAGNA